MERLKNKIYNLYDLYNSYSIEEYNDLIKQCSKLYEMSAVVFLYDNMKYHKINPNKDTYQIINTLHSKTCPQNNLIPINDPEFGKLKRLTFNQSVSFPTFILLKLFSSSSSFISFEL